MARRIELKGRPKTITGIIGLVLAAWLVFGQSFFTFNFGTFNQGFQTAWLRAGLYTLSITAINLGGAVTVDWQVGL